MNNPVAGGQDDQEPETAPLGWPEILLHQPYGHDAEQTPHPPSDYMTWMAGRLRANPQHPTFHYLELTDEQNALLDRQFGLYQARWTEAFWTAMHHLGYFCLHAMRRTDHDDTQVWVEGHAGPKAYQYEAQGVPEFLYAAMANNNLFRDFPGLN